ncbi:ABC transporter ATP-binding protein/permease [Bifidobacterium eulemuris]|uniref:ABC transporter ATP-binding protein n=1 Tax=Bifidobacterium eulemuris TaxID=1765219 RepID=A0A261G7V9_9BIFI|nr:ABC transporter ATP-binding protein/permease [Bifidobacterium eulemuris]OZG67527.1 ABC transporter ATP-binding protein [Bifidobacterium eulemuris]QOL31064.1 ABC transporter ATP-binding protein/permease [Bifidobacterium eulemuris]
MLQIKSISKQYRVGDFTQKALDGVSLNLRDNEFVAILGPSGSGKTTLLNIIGGLDRYDDGDLVINGISTKQYKDRDWDSYRNHTIGFVFQSYNLIPHQTILSNVELALTISGVSKSQRRHRARRALKQVGLGEHINKKPNQLSGGQMQRVAIARALVNNPDIVLADEPTGALDSDTSVQIMNLLKEVAKDRLVVMVTHNPELAQQYATRIVELRDGSIRSDSDPFEVTGQQSGEPVHRTMGKAAMGFTTALSLSLNNLGTKKARTFLTSFAGSIGIIGIALIMSVSNGVNTYIDDIQRETMTSYPITIEEQSIDLSSLMSQSATAGGGEEGADHANDGIYPDDSSIQRASTLTTSISENNLTAFKEYLDDPDSEIHQYVGGNGIQYSYDVKFSAYTHDPDGTLVNTDGVTVGESASNDSMAAQMATSTPYSSSTSSMSMLTGETDENAAPSSFSEIMPGADEETLISQVVTDNYEVVDGAWPTGADEVVLVLNERNEIPLTTLYELGLLPASDYQTMMDQLNADEEVETTTDKLDYATALDQTITLIPACDQYVKDDSGHWRYIGDDADEITQLVDSGTGTSLRIVGVVKPVEDAQTTLLSPGIGYTRALTDDLIDHTDSSAIVTEQQADPDHSVLNGLEFSPADDAAKAQDARTYVASLDVSDKASMARSIMGSSMDSAQLAAMSEQQIADSFDQYLATAGDDVLVTIYDRYISTGTYDDNLAAFGVVSRDAPSAINIYTDSFEAKDGISQAIENYNASADENDKITYTDYVGLLMSSVTTIVNVISYVLIAFVSVSLVVSSIMIGIITYISVLERTKEIGILRAMGASKHNVSQVFNAETGIIGLCSGLLGVGLTVLLNFPINSILHYFMETDEVNAALSPVAGVVLVVLSVVLTLIGGIIPSRKAAKQDPATALRTE